MAFPQNLARALADGEDVLWDGEYRACIISRNGVVQSDGSDAGLFCGYGSAEEVAAACVQSSRYFDLNDDFEVEVEGSDYVKRRCPVRVELKPVPTPVAVLTAGGGKGA